MWEKVYKTMQMRDWWNIIYSDETYIWVGSQTGRKGPLIVMEYPGGKGGGMNTEQYCEQVLEGALLDFCNQLKLRKQYIQFQQDGAAVHIYKRAQSARSLHSPPYSTWTPRGLPLLG